MTAPGMIGVGGTAISTSTRPDDQPGVRGPGAVAAVQPSSVRPDDRPGVRGPGAAPTVFVGSATDGFDWGDAGIGALGAFGLALLLLGTLQALSRTRRRHAVV